jgi:Transposase IS200 like
VAWCLAGVKAVLILFASSQRECRGEHRASRSKFGEVARDHVHLFVCYRSTQKENQIMRWLKGISSRVLLQNFSSLRKKFWGKHFWDEDTWP